MRMLSKLTLMLPALLSFLLITAWAGFAQSTGGWKDNFDSGMLGTFPNGWMNSGNSAVSVSNAFYVSPGNSVQMYGIVRGCWAALAHRQVVLSPPFTVQISVRNGDEALSGCHPVRATLGLNVGPQLDDAGDRVVRIRSERESVDWVAVAGESASSPVEHSQRRI